MARRAKGEGSVFKDKQGYWNAQIIIGYENGKPKYKKFRSKKQGVVVEKLNAYKLSMGVCQPEIIAGTTLKMLLDVYMTMKKNTIRPASYDSTVVTQHLIEQRIGNILLDDLSPEVIQSKLIDNMYETHAYSTIHKAYVLLNECINFAIDKDYLTKNPCRQVKVPKKENFATKEIRILTEEEITKFKKVATSLRKTIPIPKYQYGLIVTLILYTGLRVGELCALKWRDVDIQSQQLSVSKSINVMYVNGKRTLTLQNTTKSGKSRFVPLNQKAIEILEKQRSLVGGDNEDFVINGNKTLADKSVVSSSYTKICNTAQISNPSGIHSLRHTFASLALAKGVDIKVISEILGHASVNFTYNTYVHILDKQKKNAVDLLNDL